MKALRNIQFIILGLLCGIMAVFFGSQIAWVLCSLNLVSYVYFSHWYITSDSWGEWVRTDYVNHSYKANVLIGKYFRGE